VSFLLNAGPYSIGEDVKKTLEFVWLPPAPYNSSSAVLRETTIFGHQLESIVGQGYSCWPFDWNKRQVLVGFSLF
jgi:hypothetical protein